MWCIYFVMRMLLKKICYRMNLITFWLTIQKYRFEQKIHAECIYLDFLKFYNYCSFYVKCRYQRLGKYFVTYCGLSFYFPVWTPCCLKICLFDFLYFFCLSISVCLSSSFLFCQLLCSYWQIVLDLSKNEPVLDRFIDWRGKSDS